MNEIYELDQSIKTAKFDNDFEAPDAPETWSLDDFDDIVNDFGDFSF